MEYKFESKEKLAAFICNEVVDTSQAIEILSCSRQYLNKIVKQEKLKPIKEFKQGKLFFKADILQLKEKSKNKKSS